MCGERRHNFQMSTVVCTKDDDSAHLLVLHCSASLDGEISLEHLPRISTHYFCTCSNGLLFQIAAHLVKQSNCIDIPKYL